MAFTKRDVNDIEHTDNNPPPFEGDELTRKSEDIIELPSETAPSLPAEVPKPQHAVAAQGSSTNVMNTLAEEGHEDLEIGYFSYANITLKSAAFKTSDGINIGTQFDCVIMGSKAKFIIKKNKNDDDNLVFTYDKITTTSGLRVEDVLKEYAADGGTPVTTKSREVSVLMVGGELDGKMAMLSVSPTSMQRFAGYMSQTRMVTGKPISSMVTRVSVGTMFKAGKFDVYPWTFSVSPMPMPALQE